MQMHFYTKKTKFLLFSVPPTWFAVAGLLVSKTEHHTFRR